MGSIVAPLPYKIALYKRPSTRGGVADQGESNSRTIKFPQYFPNQRRSSCQSIAYPFSSVCRYCGPPKYGPETWTIQILVVVPSPACCLTNRAARKVPSAVRKNQGASKGEVDPRPRQKWASPLQVVAEEVRGRHQQRPQAVHSYAPQYALGRANPLCGYPTYSFGYLAYPGLLPAGQATLVDFDPSAKRQVKLHQQAAAEHVVLPLGNLTSAQITSAQISHLGGRTTARTTAKTTRTH